MYDDEKADKIKQMILGLLFGDAQDAAPEEATNDPSYQIPKDNSFKKNILGVEVSISLKLRCKEKPLTVADRDYVKRLERRIDDILEESNEVLAEAINRAYNEV